MYKVNHYQYIMFFILISTFTGSYSQSVVWKNYTNTNHVSTLASNDNDLWVGTSGGAVRINKTNYSKDYFYSSNSGLTQNWIDAIACGENSVWFGTHQRGMVEFIDNCWNPYLLGEANELSSYVNVIYFDGESFWAGTNDGLLHIQGDEYEVYHPWDSELIGNEVTSIIMHDQCLWIGTTEGLSKLDGEEWIAFNISNSNFEYNRIHKLTSVDTVLWVSVSHGIYTEERSLYAYRDGRFERQLDIPSNAISDLNSFQDLLWITTWDGLFSFDNETWTAYNSLNTNFKTNRFGPLVSDNHSLWVGSHDGEVYQYDGNIWTAIDLTTFPLPSNCIHTLESDNQNIWVGSDELVHFNGKDWNVYNEENSPINPFHISSLKIINQALWVGGDHRLYQLSGTKWQVFEFPEPYTNSFYHVKAICQYDSAIWVGTAGGGLLKKMKDQWEVFTTSNSEIISNSIYALECAGSCLWIGSGSGLSCYDGREWKHFYTELSSNSINALAVQDSILWVGTSRGLNRYDGESWVSFTEFNSFLSSDWVLALAVQQDTLWIGTGKALYKYDGVNGVCYYSGNSGMPGILVQALSVNEKGIWIGTQNGLGYYGNDFNTIIENDTYYIHNFKLFQNRPNPFNSTTVIPLQIHHSSDVEISIFNIAGKKVRTLLKSHLRQGEYNYQWDGRNDKGILLSSGLYICNVITDHTCKSTKIILQK